MNERIRQLAAQADADVGENVSFEFCERFAKLIVKECADVMTAQSNGFALCSNYGAVQGIDVGVRKVKQHFGVKE